MIIRGRAFGMRIIFLSSRVPLHHRHERGDLDAAMVRDPWGGRQDVAALIGRARLMRLLLVVWQQDHEAAFGSDPRIICSPIPIIPAVIEAVNTVTRRRLQRTRSRGLPPGARGIQSHSRGHDKMYRRCVVRTCASSRARCHPTPVRRAPDLTTRDHTPNRYLVFCTAHCAQAYQSARLLEIRRQTAVHADMRS